MYSSVKTYFCKITLLLVMVLGIISCRRGSGAPVSPVVSTPSGPPLLSYNTFPYGQGTDPYSGAVSFQIVPYSNYYRYAYFQIQIFGIGTYNLNGNQLFLPYLLPGNYPYTIYISCDNYTSSCPPETLSGGFYIYQATTTQVLAQP